MHLELATTFILNKLRNELSSDLKYHDVNHTKDVLQAVQFIAQQEGVSRHDFHLLSTAALFHDTGYIVSPNNHEVSSCHIALEELPNYGYRKEDMEQICLLIMATKVPQQPEDHLQQIICDADLDYLGRPDFFTRSEKLYAELMLLGDISSRKEFLQMQLQFLAAHRYFTATANRLRNKQKEEHLNKLRKSYSDIQNI